MLRIGLLWSVYACAIYGLRRTSALVFSLWPSDSGLAASVLVYFIFAPSLVAPDAGSSERDPELEEARRPCCTEEEPESYVWQQNADKTWNKEKPVDENNHGMDATRYMVAHLDLVDNGVQKIRGF